jgi:hypothetical protein
MVLTGCAVSKKGANIYSDTVPILASTATAATQPATQPASPALPSGHPDLSKLQNENASAPLPSGHPDISQLEAEAAKTHGLLIIQTVQSTPGGPKVGADNFTVSFYAKDQILDTLEGTLDQNGAACVEGIPFSLNAHAVVKVTHNGVEYQATSKVVDGKSPHVTLEVPVYEKTSATTKPSVSLAPRTDARESAKMLAASSGAFMLLFGVGFMLFKGSKR